MTVNDVINNIIEKTQVPRLPIDKTCDKLIIGDANIEVKKIVTTFMATIDVIKKAIEINANLIITHEPTWFSSYDDTDWLVKDYVYNEKLQLLKKHGIAIWRFHDHMHIGKEDGIYRGFEIETGWQNNVLDKDYIGKCYKIPKTSLRDLSAFFKNTLQMDVIQIVGDPDSIIEGVSVLVGGGSLGLDDEKAPIKIMQDNDIDLIVCGEIIEWTLCAYVKDAVSLGLNKSMLVLGHERSEEPGMKHLGAWLKDILPDIEVEFIDAKEPFAYL